MGAVYPLQKVQRLLCQAVEGLGGAVGVGIGTDDASISLLKVQQGLVWVEGIRSACRSGSIACGDQGLNDPSGGIGVGRIGVPKRAPAATGQLGVVEKVQCLLNCGVGGRYVPAANEGHDGHRGHVGIAHVQTAAGRLQPAPPMRDRRNR